MKRHCVSHRIIVGLMGVTLAGLVSCGGEGGPPANDAAELSSEEEAEFQLELEYAACLRDHGIENYPDPRVDVSGYLMVGIPMDPESGEWVAAQEACQPIFDEGASGNETETVGSDWERVVPGGDCECSDGSEFNFWVRHASAVNVILYLQSGGGCFSAETCDPDRDLYHTTVEEGPGQGGIFDFADERNPFADYSAVYVPYCTGDTHLGNAVTEYTSDLTVHHRGYVNGTAALDHLASTFPHATNVVVVGESAGSVAAPLYAGLVSDRLPDAAITVLADGSGAYPDLPAVMNILAEAWGTADTIPAWPENAGWAAEGLSFPGLFIESGRHDPQIVFARHDYAYDDRQAFWFEELDIPVDDLLSLMQANERQIEAAGVNLLSYTAPGEEHTAITDGTFYTEEVNGRALVDWVAGVIDGEQVGDVACTECRGS